MTKKKNPFRIKDEAFTIKAKTINRPVPTEIVNELTGEVVRGYNLSVVSRETDTMRFVKIYDTSTFDKIGAAGFKLLIYVIRFVGYDNKVFLSKDYFKKKFGYKQVRSFYNAIDELVDAKVIKKDEGALYWVNPNIICKGSRKFEE